MNTRISMLAAAAAIATMPLLAACGSSDQPQSSSAPPASQVATPAAASSAPAPESPASESAAAPSSEPAPSTGSSEDAGAVKSASEKWVKSALTLGYPDKTASDYLARLKPLMTSRGYAEVKKSADKSKSLQTGITTLAKNKGRSTPEFSTVKVNSITADAATSKLGYQLMTQQLAGGKWKTLRTSAEETVTVKLVNQGGKWLVDDAR